MYVDLQYQHSRVLADNMTPKHYSNQIGSLNRLMSFLGQGCKIESISTLDLQHYKRKLQSHYGSPNRLNLNISDMKAMFHWARRNDVLETIPNIDVISKGKVVRKRMYTFNSQQIKKLLSAANVKMKAMIWLILQLTSLTKAPLATRKIVFNNNGKSLWIKYNVGT